MYAMYTQVALSGRRRDYDTGIIWKKNVVPTFIYISLTLVALQYLCIILQHVHVTLTFVV